MRWPGEDQLVAALLSRWDRGRLLILDDVRYLHTLDLVVAASEQVVTIFIDCPDSIRFERLRLRDGLIDQEEFGAAASRRTEGEIGRLESRASSVLVNDGALKAFRAKLDALAASWAA
jgi:dephospho-CoA kinase